MKAVMRRALPAVLAAALSIVGCRGEPPVAKHVVLVTLDTLRTDHVGVYGGDVATPHVDGIAAAGARSSRSSRTRR